MSHTVIEDACIGCGACEYACPTGALTKTDSFLGLFEIEPLTCNDCGQCVPKCPVDAIAVDPAWARCQARGCPLSSNRMATTECTFWLRRCTTCGSPMWREREGPPRGDELTVPAALDDDQRWACPTCDLALKVTCPRVRQSRRAVGADTP